MQIFTCLYVSFCLLTCKFFLATCKLLIALCLLAWKLSIFHVQVFSILKCKLLIAFMQVLVAYMHVFGCLHASFWLPKWKIIYVFYAVWYFVPYPLLYNLWFLLLSCAGIKCNLTGFILLVSTLYTGTKLSRKSKQMQVWPKFFLEF